MGDRHVRRTWKEEAAVVYISRFSPSIRLKGLCKITEALSQDHRCPGQDTNRTPSEYRSELLPFETICPVFRRVGPLCFCSPPEKIKLGQQLWSSGDMTLQTRINAGVHWKAIYSCSFTESISVYFVRNLHRLLAPRRGLWCRIFLTSIWTIKVYRNKPFFVLKSNTVYYTIIFTNHSDSANCIKFLQ